MSAARLGHRVVLEHDAAYHSAADQRFSADVNGYFCRFEDLFERFTLRDRAACWLSPSA